MHKVSTHVTDTYNLMNVQHIDLCIYLGVLRKAKDTARTLLIQAPMPGDAKMGMELN